jgi:tetratricopeptide (TPR) repeat protein
VQHIEQHVLGSYLSGDLPEKDLRYCERHLVECDACRGQLAFLVRVLNDSPSADEAAVLDSVESAPISGRDPFNAPSLSLYDRFSRWAAPAWKLAAVSVSLIMLVAITWAFFQKDGSEKVLRGAGSERTFEARLSGQPYAEFVHTRTGPVLDSHSSNPSSASSDDQLKRLSANPHELGRFYLEHDEFAKAVAQLEEAGRNAPASAEIGNDLGVAYMESGGDGSLEKAVAKFQRALQLSPRYQPALFNLALAHERLGHFSEAEQQLKLYLQMDSDSDWAKEVKSKLQLWKH